MTPEHLNAYFGALSHPTRRVILDRLAAGEANLSELAADLPIALNTVSKHVRVLEEAQLVAREVKGRDHVLSLCPEQLSALQSWVANATSQWTSRLAAMERHLDQKAKRQ